MKQTFYYRSYFKYI